MTGRRLAALSLVLAFAAGPAGAAYDTALTRMALCQDSWFVWTKTAPDQFKAFAGHFMSGFKRNGNDPFFVPRARSSVAGLNVVQAFPENVGMGVGFSLTLDVGFDRARKVMEARLGRKLEKCEASDGMHSCELDIAEQRTFTLMAEDGVKNRTLIGCYYFYEK